MTLIGLKEGVGKHVEVVLASDPKALTIILKSITPAEICYTLSILFAKYSILGFYSRIFNFSAMKTALIVIFLVVTGWAISVVSLLIPRLCLMSCHFNLYVFNDN